MSPRSDERGFTLIELVLVMSLALLLLGATLTSFNQFERSEKQNQTLNDSAQVARNAMDLAAHQLRNLANQDPTQQQTTIARALPYDLVFQTSDPSRKWERYCLDTSATGNAAASTSRGMLWESETATATAPTAGMMGSCPGTGWVSRVIVSDFVTNQDQSLNRSVFTYSCAPSAPVGCPASPADYSRITNIGAQLYVDPTRAGPRPSCVSSRVSSCATRTRSRRRTSGPRPWVRAS